MGLFFLIWLVTFFVLFFVIKKITPNGYLLGVITAVLVYAAGRLFVHTRPAETTITYCPSASVEGWES
jgi:multisubunit Na+/H+ antiporter MnhE subunit